MSTAAMPSWPRCQSLNTVTLPTGEKIDFGHMLASMNLVYNGIPITGSWGGDCQQLAQQYYGQAQDAAGYAAAMRATFNIDDDGSLSKFGDQDLRADMDSVIVGSKVTQDTDLADALRSYYENLTEYDRAKEFISLSFGTQDTSNSSFADAVYRALLDDSGMQLLFYMNGMWSVNGWQIKEDYAPAVRGAADLFAEYLAGAVNHEKVKSETNDRLVAMAGRPCPMRWPRWGTAMPPQPRWLPPMSWPMAPSPPSPRGRMRSPPHGTPCRPNLM